MRSTDSKRKITFYNYNIYENIMLRVMIARKRQVTLVPLRNSLQIESFGGRIDLHQAVCCYSCSQFVRAKREEALWCIRVPLLSSG